MKNQRISKWQLMAAIAVVAVSVGVKVMHGNQPNKTDAFFKDFPLTAKAIIEAKSMGVYPAKSDLYQGATPMEANARPLYNILLRRAFETPSQKAERDAQNRLIHSSGVATKDLEIMEAKYHRNRAFIGMIDQTSSKPNSDGGSEYRQGLNMPFPEAYGIQLAVETNCIRGLIAASKQEVGRSIECFRLAFRCASHAGQHPGVSGALQCEMNISTILQSCTKSIELCVKDARFKQGIKDLITNNASLPGLPKAFGQEMVLVENEIGRTKELTANPQYESVVLETPQTITPISNRNTGNDSEFATLIQSLSRLTNFVRANQTAIELDYKLLASQCLDKAEPKSPLVSSLMPGYIETIKLEKNRRFKTKELLLLCLGETNKIGH